MAQRRELQYDSEEAVIADVERLRQGYAQAGGWSLPQICWHLDVTTSARMNPGEFKPNTPEQDERRPVFEQVLATGRLPDRLPAPEAFLPPPNVGEDAIDAFLATMRKWKAYAGRIGQHRLFGNLTAEQGKRINLIHCAHHLSFLSPL